MERSGFWLPLPPYPTPPRHATPRHAAPGGGSAEAPLTVGPRLQSHGRGPTRTDQKCHRSLRITNKCVQSTSTFRRKEIRLRSLPGSLTRSEQRGGGRGQGIPICCCNAASKCCTDVYPNVSAANILRGFSDFSKYSGWRDPNPCVCRPPRWQLCI